MRVLRLAPFLGPGLLICLIALVWGSFLKPARYRIDEWAGRWIEPKMPAGFFRSWRRQEDRYLGQTEFWPHKHLRANSYLRSPVEFDGDVEVALTASFDMGRYVGCYLCYDPSTDSGYWLATGHPVGEDANQAYIKIIRDGKWTVVAQAPLEIIAGQEYRFLFRRIGDRLEFLVHDRPVVSWTDASFHRGVVQLRLHNTKVYFRDLVVRCGATESTPSDQ